MSRLTSFWRNLFRRARVEGELDDELRAMFELLVEENVRAGMTKEEARRLARRKLGSIDTIKAQGARRASGSPGRPRGSRLPSRGSHACETAQRSTDHRHDICARKRRGDDDVRAR